MGQMGKKFVESKAFNIILSILIGVGLWVYVTSIVNDDAGSIALNNVVVSVLGEDVLYGKGYMIDPDTELSVDLRLDGSRSVLVAISGSTSDYITATVDVSSITASGTYELPVKIQLKNVLTSSIISIEDQDDQTVMVTVVKMMEKTVEVRGVFTGTVPEGYRTESPELSPSSIQVIGAEEEVNQIDYAQVNITGEHLTSTFNGAVSFHYVDEAGNALRLENVTTDVGLIDVIMPVVKTIEVPLTVEFLYGGGITQDNVDEYVNYTIDPAYIQLSGDEFDVDNLDGSTIRLGQIDLATVDGSREFEFSITPDSSLTNDSGISTATIMVWISNDLESKTVETNNIELANYDESLEVYAVTQSLQVKLRGPAEAVDDIESYQLRVVADLSDEILRSGTQVTVPVKVYFDGDSQCSVVTGERGYSIVIYVA